MKKTIIPVAGGKGGVGKSLLVANLGIALAEAGCSTVVVDLDLGSSNLHTYLGLNNDYPGIGDFLKARKQDIENLVYDTEINNLKFLPGDGKSPFMANIPYAQKIRLVREIQKIPARYILLDLGAGSSFNTLDFFGVARHGIIVTTFEYAAIMNVLVFLRNFIFRLIRGAVRHNRNALTFMEEEVFKRPMTEDTLTIPDVLGKISATDVESGIKAQKICEYYRPRFVFNMGDHPEELNVVNHLDQTIKQKLSLNVDYIGFIFNEGIIRESVKKKLPLVPHYRDSFAADEINGIARRIINYWDGPVDNSLERLIAVVRKNYEQRYE